MILFIPLELVFNMAFRTTITFRTEETTHLQPDPLNPPSLSREKHPSIPAIMAKKLLTQ
jgi:hypothetical protein